MPRPPSGFEDGPALTYPTGRTAPTYPSTPPLPDLFYLDRYRNEGTRTYSRHSGYTAADERYRPEGPQQTVPLAAWLVPGEEMNVYRAGPGPDLEAAYLPGDTALFLVHPQVQARIPDDPYLQRTRELGTPTRSLATIPSSSTRTLYVKGATQAVKVHFPFRISRYGRRMRDEVVEQAVTVSRILERWAMGQNGSFVFLREVLGVTHRNLQPEGPRGENWGYLVRDMLPFPPLDEPGHLVPGFALYGGDRFHPGRPPLVLSLMDPRDPLGWLLESVLLPVVRNWVACYRETGFILEPHGQNVLLEMDDLRNVRRIVHRDLSVGIDMRRRRDLGLPDHGFNAYNRMEDGAFASIAYDKFMGGHFFHALLAPVLAAYPHLCEEDFRAPCRDEFARLFPEHEDYLPRTVRYFAEERDRFGKPLLQDTGTAPVWRP